MRFFEGEVLGDTGPLTGLIIYLNITIKKNFFYFNIHLKVSK